MKDKKIKAICSVITIVLIICIGILVNNIINKENKEVKVARDFIQNLAEKNIIDYYSKDSEVYKNDSLNKSLNNASKIQYSVLIGNYGVDMDDKYNVIGFSNKNINNLSNELKVTSYAVSEISDLDEGKAIDYAKKYIKEISEDSFIFKEVKNKEEEENPCYIVVFYKCKDGYPIYKQEITVLIDKESLRLQGYSNYTLENREYINDLNINKEDAIKIVLDNLNDLKINKDDISIIDTAYVESEKDKLVLSYIVNIENKLEENNEKYLVIIRGDSGEIINSNIEVMKK